MTNDDQDEQEFYEMGLSMWIGYYMGICPANIIKKIDDELKIDFIKHYDKENGFNTKKDVRDFFTFITIIYHQSSTVEEAEEQLRKDKLDSTFIKTFSQFFVEHRDKIKTPAKKQLRSLAKSLTT